MPRIARVVAPGVPHHVTQRGNRKQRTFFCEEDFRAYKDMLALYCRRHQVEIWAYCLMPNHIHLIATPADAKGLHGSVAETHRRYTLRINKRNGWQGCLWQGRFFSYPMDEHHLLAAVRYIELNPMRGGLVIRPEAYPWSSAAAHITGKEDGLVKIPPLLEKIGDWSKFLSLNPEEEEIERLHRHQRTGRPLGDESFISALEEATGRVLQPKKPGPEAGAARKKSHAKLQLFGEISNVSP